MTELTPREKYEVALKKVHTSKTNDNFMLIKLAYDKNLVLPYKDGLSFMASLACAESLGGSHYKKHLLPFDQSILEVQILSSKDRERYQLATLLDLSFDEIKEYETS